MSDCCFGLLASANLRGQNGAETNLSSAGWKGARTQADYATGSSSDNTFNTYSGAGGRGSALQSRPHRSRGRRLISAPAPAEDAVADLIARAEKE